MNNDILFEIAKYLEKSTDIPIVDEAYESSEVLRQCRKNVSEFLNSKITQRPSKDELEEKNIIKTKQLDFDEIHTILESIDFLESVNLKEKKPRISPRIANIAKKIDFAIRRKIMKKKLGLHPK